MFLRRRSLFPLVLLTAGSSLLLAQTPAPSQASGSSQPASSAPQTPKPLPPTDPSNRTKDPDRWAQLDRFRDANAKLPVNAEGRVVFFGDSITEGWPKRAPFFPGKPYVNRGISGQTTSQMVMRLQQDVLDLHPAAVVILAGINDIAQNQGPISLQDIEANLQSMILRSKAAGVRVIMTSVLPAADFPWRKGLDPAPKVQQLNAWLSAFCAQNQVAYVDYYTSMADANGGMKPGLSSDGVHPTADGYAIMEPLAEAAIEKALASPPGSM